MHLGEIVESKLLYFQGKYEQSIAVWQKNPKIADNHAYAVASYFMLGREEEAELQLQARDWSDELRIVVQFFWIISLLRRSQYAQARSLIKDSFFLSKKIKRNLFYFHQAHAFYRYFTGSFEKSLKQALRAMYVCDQEGQSYERIYCIDIIGHIYNQTGAFHKSIDFLEKAKNFAESLDCDGTALAIYTTIIGYKLEAGFELKENVPNALAILQGSKTKEFYLQAQTQLQLAKAYYFMGDLPKVRETLKAASYNIYRTKNNRQSILLNIMQAHLLSLQKNYEQALFSLVGARQFIHKGVDNVLELKLLGMEKSILQKLGQKDDEIEQRKELMESKSSYFLNRVINSYQDESVDLRDVSDPIYMLLRSEDRQSIPKKEFILKLDQSQLLGLLNFFTFSKDNCVLFGLKKNCILVLYENHVYWSSPHLTRFQYNILKFIFERRNLTKKELVENIWNYRYVGYKHDALVYNTLSRIKKRTPGIANLIQVFEGIQIQADIKVYGLEKVILKKLNASSLTSSLETIKTSNLNYRQLQLVEQLNRGVILKPREYQKQFEVSRITVTRDLSELVEEGLLIRKGKARSVHYIRV